MHHAISAIEKVTALTDKALLFHSGSGKDSIALLDMLSPRFREVVCVYMYVVKDLQHINRYFTWSLSKYKNVRFMQIPHFILPRYMRDGFMGCEKKKVNFQRFTHVVDKARELSGIEWAFIGFKQADSMNRLLMLRTYEDECINYTVKKCFPLSKYNNRDVMGYINANNLISPEKYGKGMSSGVNIGSIDYLLYLKKNFPNDLKKIFAVFPQSERFLFEYEYRLNNENKAERNNHD